MAKYIIDEKILKDLADAIRSKDGSNELMKPQSMAAKILEIESAPETLVLVDAYGNEYTAVLIDDNN